MSSEFIRQVVVVLVVIVVVVVVVVVYHFSSNWAAGMAQSVERLDMYLTVRGSDRGCDKIFRAHSHRPD
jgi:uncharacterized membrane protein affecting hemolysin expression